MFGLGTHVGEKELPLCSCSLKKIQSDLSYLTSGIYSILAAVHFWARCCFSHKLGRLLLLTLLALMSAKRSVCSLFVFLLFYTVAVCFGIFIHFLFPHCFRCFAFEIKSN